MINNQLVTKSILQEYETTIRHKSSNTIETYMRVLSHFVRWFSNQIVNNGEFRPENLTANAVQEYFKVQKKAGHALSHQSLIKSALSGFCNWLLEEGYIKKNPVKAIELPPQPLLAPRELSDDQRYVLKDLVERDGSLRSAAIFSLGYWAGCRVSDVSWLELENCVLSSQLGTITVGHKQEKMREIRLKNEARKALVDYISSSERKFPDSPYVFTSQRSQRISEDGIHFWFRTLKSKATVAEHELIKDLSFHDLRHDFAHRLKEAGFSDAEVAVYLGHITKKGYPAIQTTARYTQPGVEKIGNKLSRIDG